MKDGVQSAMTKVKPYNTLSGLQSNQLAWKITSSPQVHNYFPSPEFFKTKTNFLISMAVFLLISTNIWVKRVHISSEIVFYDAKYHLRMIFSAARINIFGKVVTLGLKNVYQTYQHCIRISTVNSNAMIYDTRANQDR